MADLNNYDLIKKYINKMLEDAEKPLKAGMIEEKIEFIRDAIHRAGPQLAAQFIAPEADVIEDLATEDWEQMIKEFKSDFSVTHERGVALTGTEQRTRDAKWWERFKGENELYYWERYKKYMEKDLPYEVVKTTDVDTDYIMSFLANPQEDQFERYGMVVGHVQSGKTGNYSALISKAADAGYKFIVVIAGGLNNLRNQTQDRINESFIGRDESKVVGVGRYSGTVRGKTPVSLTTAKSDFKASDASRAKQSLTLEMGQAPVILVIKKNTSTLRNVVEWLKSHYQEEVKEHAMLLIDDESDYASINTNQDDNPTAINKKIRELLHLFRKKAYVAYTATPYANIFIDHNVEHDEFGKDLFPEDFIYTLKAPSNYFGAAKIFLDENRRFWIEVNDHFDIFPSGHKKTLEVEDLPESLKEAIRLFILNVAIRHLRRQESKHNSMMIHVTRFTNVHNRVYFKTSEYLDELKKRIIVHGGDPSNNKVKDIKNTYNKYYGGTDKEPQYFNWELVLSKIVEIIKKIETKEVHKDSRDPLVYDDDHPGNYIVVGGTSLARGYTLEGLSVSYFLRNTILYDTLMQMGRWFGYRNNYEDLCKVFMTEDYYNKFSVIIGATLDLVDSLERMKKLDMTPKDFGLAVQHHPDSGLQVTARNKLKRTTDIHFEMDLSGHLKETAWLANDDKIVNKNLEIAKDFISNLPKDKMNQNFNKSGVIKNTVWKKIDSKSIESFLEAFKCYKTDEDEFGMYSRMPLRFVKEYVAQTDTDWDVVLHTGSHEESIKIDDTVSYGTYQKRTIDKKGDRYEFRNRQVSSGTAEEVTLPDFVIEVLKDTEKEIKRQRYQRQQNERDDIDENLKDFSRRKTAREYLKRPLLMIHLFKITYSNDETEKELAAFSISFPSKIKSVKKNIKLKVNSVYLEKLERELREQDDFDDTE